MIASDGKRTISNWTPPTDEELGRGVAKNRLFDENPVGLYDSLVARFGQERADVIWRSACEAYDEERS